MSCAIDLGAQYTHNEPRAYDCDGHGGARGQHVDAGRIRRHGAHRLEPDWHVVRGEEEGGKVAKDEQAAAGQRALPHHGQRHRGLVALPVLRGHPRDKEDGEEGEQQDDAPRTPGILDAPPLQRQQQADDGGDEDERAEEIEAGDEVVEAMRFGNFTFGGDLDEEEDDEKGDAADGQVDPEAPSLKTGLTWRPLSRFQHMYLLHVTLSVKTPESLSVRAFRPHLLLIKHTSERRCNDLRNARHATECTRILGQLINRNKETNQLFPSVSMQKLCLRQGRTDSHPSMPNLR